jgi:hypothetical protein
MGNNGLKTENRFTTESSDPRYHLRLLGVLAVLVDHDVWQDAVRIVDLLDRTPENVPAPVPPGCDACRQIATAP